MEAVATIADSDRQFMAGIKTWTMNVNESVSKLILDTGTLNVVCLAPSCGQTTSVLLEGGGEGKVVTFRVRGCVTEWVSVWVSELEWLIEWVGEWTLFSKNQELDYFNILSFLSYFSLLPKT